MKTELETTDALADAEAVCRSNGLDFHDRKLASEGKWAEVLRAQLNRHRAYLFVGVPLALVFLLKIVMFWVWSIPSQDWLGLLVLVASVLIALNSRRVAGRCASALRGLGEVA